MMKKVCELCSSQARMYCDSDQASLCWDCDEKVHGANFLVAKHTRTVLCHVCQSQTPWKAAGLKLGRTVSLCDCCVGRSSARKSSANEKNEAVSEGGRGRVAQSRTASAAAAEGCDCDDDDLEDDDLEDDYESCSDDDYDVEERDEEDENQVVPWTSSPPLNPAAITTATASTSSSVEDESYFRASSRFAGGSAALKRIREIAFLHSSSDHN